MRFEKWLDEVQLKKLNEWYNTRDGDLCPGVSGGRFTWEFTDTTLGQVIKVRDNHPKANEPKVIDLTRYDYW